MRPKPASTPCTANSKKCGGIFDLAKRKARIAELEKETAKPGFWDDANKAREVMNQLATEREFVTPFENLAGRLNALSDLVTLASDPSEAEMARMALDELDRDLPTLEEDFHTLERKSLLNGPLDFHNAFVSFHAGAGGTESCDWAAMLLRMIRRYCERKGFQTQILDWQDGEEAGIKSATMKVVGPFAYGLLKSERGVHRLVRISPFDANKRRHTSFAAVDVVAEVDENVEVEINEADLKIDTFRSSGAGGQHVNKTESAIRITHVPSGIVVACQSERSQHQNRAMALAILKARLYEMERDKKQREMDRFYGEKGDIAWGSQIRSYVLQPYTQVRDERSELKTANVQAVLDGDLDLFVEAFLKQQQRN